MAWTTQQKTIAVAAPKGWPCAKYRVVGRKPLQSSLNFGPYALYLAAARASHLHDISPGIGGPEVQMIERLLKRHVDDVSSDFSIELTAASFKDFVDTYFTGTVAAGIALLAMINEGYRAFAHFELLSGGAPGIDTTPDFVVYSATKGVALMEAKGSASSQKTFKQALRDGYRKQVEPHLGHTVGGVTASHGYCVGSWLRKDKVAETRIHYTQRASPGPARRPRPGPIARSNVIRQNYASAFALVHGLPLARAIRSSTTEIDALQFSRVRWRGRNWLTAPNDGDLLRLEVIAGEAETAAFRFGVPTSHQEARLLFAIEEEVAQRAILALLSPFERYSSAWFDRPERSQDSRPDDRGFDDYDDGAVLPDGLALIDSASAVWMPGRLQWNPRRGDFSS